MGNKRGDLGSLTFLVALISIFIAIGGWVRISRLRRQTLLLFRALRAIRSSNAN